jgi:UDP-3-O-[3-hydroxymyristoyl] glucosamine N-acyltransferase
MNRTEPHDTFTLAQALGGRTEGPGRAITKLVSPRHPLVTGLVVADSEAALRALDDAPVGAVVVPEGLACSSPHPLIRVPDVRVALAQLSVLFDGRPVPAQGVSPQAFVHPTAQLGEGVSLAPGVVIEAHAVLGRGCMIGSGSVVGAGTVVGDDTRLHANVTLYDGVRIGSRVILHSGAIVGADGFGYAPGPRGAQKIHHLGTVIIEDDVEIGANTCIDRGTLEATVIGARTKIDNLCQIGHNVRIGTDCLLAGMVGIAGSTILGDRVTVGGDAGFADHLSVGDGATIAGRAGVTKNIPGGETWAGFPAQPYRKWVRNLYLQNKLETLWQAFKKEST